MRIAQALGFLHKRFTQSCRFLATTILHLESRGIQIARKSQLSVVKVIHAATMDTTRRIKAQFPDLNFVKPMLVHDHPRYKAFGIDFSPNRREVLPKGHVKEPGRKAVLVDTVAERDVQVPLRDGLHVYADIYRPESSSQSPVPAVICWSPYGKPSISLDMTWNRTVVPKNWAPLSSGTGRSVRGLRS